MRLRYVEKILAFSYSRVSKDDNTPGESNSITNQILMIREYASRSEELEIVEEFSDDGYSGINFERPAFQKMMEKLKNGEANAIIVKDLSRFGRNYIETGKYIEQTLPQMGVRFIAINDNVDSAHFNRSDDLIIPVKNLMNDTYCRDLSVKLRGQFDVCRRQGMFIGAFACYGYLKDPQDRHKLILDEHASQNVRKMFQMKMEGYSNKAIADYFNEIGELAPADYKKHLGMKYETGFQVNRLGKWDAVTVRRILTNRVYIGELVQGKTGTLNYKCKKRIEKQPSEWIVVQNVHEKTVSRESFQIVERILERDTLCAPRQDKVYPLSGMVFCADCGAPMVKSIKHRGEKVFSYYICRSYKENGGCKSHRISVEALEKSVMDSIRMQIEAALDLKKLIGQLEKFSMKSCRIEKLKSRLIEIEEGIRKKAEYKEKLYEAKVDQIITQDEYTAMKMKYLKEIDHDRYTVTRIEEEIEYIRQKGEEEDNWIGEIEKFKGAKELSRIMVVSLIDKILVYHDKRIEILFNYRDEMQIMENYIAQRSREAG